MDYVNLGSTGLKVSRLCLGCMSYGDQSWRRWILNEDDSRPFFRQALEGGINFFDTADIYSHGASEAVTGRALRDFARRDEVVLATKLFNRMGPGANQRGLSRKHILSAIDASLRRLGTDHVDLYQVHRFDYETPVAETMQALHDVVRSGKALYIGASSMFAWQFARMNHVAALRGWTRFVSMQPQLSLVYREEEREMLPLCREDGIGVIPWSPLAQGFLAGNRRRDGQGETRRARNEPYAGFAEADFAVRDVREAVAAARGGPPARLALAWVLGRPGVTAPILGATGPDHVAEALSALQLTLSAEEIAALDAPYRPRAVADHD